MPLLSFSFLETAAQPHSTIALRVAMAIDGMLYSFLGAMGLGGAIFFCAVPCCWVVWKQRRKRAHEWRMSSRSLEGRIRRTEATLCVERTTTKTASLSCESTHDGSSDEFTYTVYDLIFQFLALDGASVHFNVCGELRGQIGARLREQTCIVPRLAFRTFCTTLRMSEISNLKKMWTANSFIIRMTTAVA